MAHRILLLALLVGCEPEPGASTEGDSTPTACEVASQRILEVYEGCGVEASGGSGGGPCSSSQGAVAVCAADCHEAGGCAALVEGDEAREALLMCIAQC